MAERDAAWMKQKIRETWNEGWRDGVTASLLDLRGLGGEPIFCTAKAARFEEPFRAVYVNGYLVGENAYEASLNQAIDCANEVYPGND